MLAPSAEQRMTMSIAGRQTSLPRAVLLALVIAGCGFGLVFGWLAAGGVPPMPQPEASPTPPRPTPHPLPPSDVPFGVLVGLLDQVAGAPQLRGAWLIYTLPEAHNVYLQGLPYDLKCTSPDGTPVRLDEAYLSTAGGLAQGDKALRTMVQRVFPAQTVDYVLILNAPTLDELASWLEPVTIGNHAPGTPPSSLWFDPAGSDASLSRQEEILTGFLAALHRASPDAVSTSLYGSVNRTGRTDMSQEQFRVFLRYLDALAGAAPANPERSPYLRLDPSRQYCQP